MEPPTTTKLRIGDWYVDPTSSQISRDGETAHVEARTMRLLLVLAERKGEVVSIDDLLNLVWADVVVSPDSVYQSITSLRRLLGDNPKQPIYIATVPRLGYRMVASVSPWPADRPAETPQPQQPAQTTIDAPTYGFRRRAGFTGNAFTWIATAAISVTILAAVVAFRVHSQPAGSTHAAEVATQPQQAVRSIAVLPFLDLTQAMNEEPFADGMTEELIDRLSKIPGIRVPSPTASFYFKGKQIPVAEIAKSLGVAYILDGSVRRSGARLRVAARLIRADTGYIVWTENYDRPFHDILMVQDDIASEVTKALSTSIEAK